jgi:hypothetical protein
MVGREGNRNVVTAADFVARSFGIRLGMPATQAQALVAELVVQEADPDGDRASLERLAIWALRYSPVVSAAPQTDWSSTPPVPIISMEAKKRCLPTSPDGSLRRG